jgi:4-amino-4-deoxy-L-arabinose transferase-like glycosyltransferase
MTHTLIRYLIIAIAGTLLFVPFLGQAHLFDWDEINFAECAREMILTGDYLRTQIDFQPFWEKPPLFIWMQALSMKLFGINEFAARFPNALMGVVTLCTLYHIGRKVVHEKMATWWVALYAATWLPHFYFKSGIIDPTFNFFIFVAFYQLHLVRFSSQKLNRALLAGIFLGLAVLTKGPVAILIALLSLGVYIVINRGLWGYRMRDLVAVTAGAALVGLAWCVALIAVHGWTYFQWFFGAFTSYQIRLLRTEDAGHGGPFVYHFLILLLGCFPASLFLFQYSRRRITDNEPGRDFTRWMWIIFWVVLLLFSVVKTKIVHYSSLCYFPLTWLAALQLYRLSEGQSRLKPLVRNLLLVIGTLLALAILLLPLAGIFKQKLFPYIKDPFAVANMQAAVSWSPAESLWGLMYLAGIWTAALLMRRHFRKGMLLLCAIQLVIIQVTITHFTPKIEAYSQRAAVAFFEELQGKDVYVHVLGYKSYAHLFYTRKTPPSDTQYYDKSGRVNEAWLLEGRVDKPVFFVCKITAAERYEALPQLEEIGRKNGFVFFRRKS